MTDKLGKYAAALAAINEPKDEPPPTVLLPVKAPPPAGKRSTPGWRQKSILLWQPTIDDATARLKRRSDKTDFSDLMQFLLEAWLRTPE